MVWNKGLKVRWKKGEIIKCINCKKLFPKMQCYQKCCSDQCSKDFKSKYHKEYIKNSNYKNIRKKYDNKYLSSDYYKNEVQQKRKEYQKDYKQTKKYKDKSKEYYSKLEIKLKRKIYNHVLHQQESYKIKKKLYRQSEKGKNILRMHARNRKAKIKNIIHNFTLKQWLDKLENSNGYCKNCNKFFGKYNLTMDHTYPISKAYEDFLRTGIKRIYTIDDVEPFCKSCNSSKYNLIVMKGGKIW